MTNTNSQAQRVIDADKDARERIKTVRLQCGMTQAQIARALGIGPQQYHKYETGVLRLSAGMISQIAEALDCSILDVLPGTKQSHDRLDAEIRIDILKREISEAVLDISSEDVLVAIRTLVLAAGRPA